MKVINTSLFWGLCRDVQPTILMSKHKQTASSPRKCWAISLAPIFLLLFKTWNAVPFQPWNCYQLRVTHQQSCWVNQRAEQQGFSCSVPLPQFLWQILFFRVFIFPGSCKAKTPNWIETSSVNCAGVSSASLWAIWRAPSLWAIQCKAGKEQYAAHNSRSTERNRGVKRDFLEEK